MIEHHEEFSGALLGMIERARASVPDSKAARLRRTVWRR
jgi:hypothetical protein